jgi:hypothetical protein
MKGLSDIASLIATGCAVIVLALAGCAGTGGGGSGWVTLIDGGKGLENFTQLGDANWRVEDGAIVADKGKGGHLVSKNVYKDFEIRAEFWAAADTNSGIFIRNSDPQKPGSTTGYEVNIWDIRPAPVFGTGAIVGVAGIPTPIQHTAGGKWNVMEIHAQGPEIIVKLNGVVTSRATDARFPQGPFTLQYGAGVKGAVGGPIKWRKVEIRSL